MKKYQLILVLLLTGFLPALSGKEKLGSGHSVKSTSTKTEPVTVESETGFWKQLLSFLNYPVDLFLPHYERRTRMYITETQYNTITVEQDESGRRHLVFSPGKGSQSIYQPSAPDNLVSNYMRRALFLSLMALKNPPERVLFIGMGGGIMPTFLRKYFPNTDMDIVELDGKIPEIAEKYFGFIKDNHMQLIIEDARVYVNRCRKQYDIIFLDAYNANYIPFQLTTVEFMSKLKQILAPNGILNINIANFRNYNFIKSELKTINQVFGQMLVFVCPHETNYVPLVRNGPPLRTTELRTRGIELKQHHTFCIDILALLDSEMPDSDLKKYLQEGTLLTDDHAPVNLLQ